MTMMGQQLEKVVGISTSGRSYQRVLSTLNAEGDANAKNVP